MKRISRILVLGGVAAAALAALLAALFLLMSGGGEDTAQAAGGDGSFPTIFGVDVDVDDNDDGSPDNTATSLGTIDACIEVESTDTGPGVPGPVFDIDVFLDDVPVGKDLAGANFFMYYDQNYLRVNGWVGPTGIGCLGWLLSSQAHSSVCMELGETIWPDTDGSLVVSIADHSGPAGAELPGALGVLDRYEMEVVQAGPQVVAITFAPAPTYLTSSVPQGYDPAIVLDANYDPPYGVIAIDTPCPPLGDSDEDTIPDGEDNCALVSNPLQEDFDEDAAGDACDGDDDNDGLLDGEDPNPLNPDCDGDGVSVAAADWDGDGQADVLAAARAADGPEGTREDAGQAYVIPIGRLN